MMLSEKRQEKLCILYDLNNVKKTSRKEWKENIQTKSI